METYKTIQNDKYRVEIVTDPCPSHPLDMTDAPVFIHLYGVKDKYNRNHIPDRLRTADLVKLYFLSYGNETYEVEKERAKRGFEGGFICANNKEWLEYTGSELTEEVLRGFLKELLCYYNGEVYGYIVKKVRTIEGETFISTEETDSCWGFYGLDSLKESGYLNQYLSEKEISEI